VTPSSYKASDGSLASDSATVTLTVTADNDSPTVAVARGGACGTDDHSGSVNLTVADVESSAADLTLSAAPSGRISCRRRVYQMNGGSDLVG
jgi:hypothetical protein